MVVVFSGGYILCISNACIKVIIYFKLDMLSVIATEASFE